MAHNGQSKRAPQPPPADTPPRKVFLVDDHAIVRQGLKMVIAMQPDLEVCGEASDAQSAFGGVEESKPDVVIADITLEHGSGLELIKDLRVRWPNLLILVVTMHGERMYGERCLRAGASGYITKAEAIDEVVNALRVILNGKIFISDTLAEHMMAHRISGMDAIARDPVGSLSDRELEIFQMIGDWRGTREIADDLKLSIKTIEYYRETIKRKLNLKSAKELVHAATSWAGKENPNTGESPSLPSE